MLDPPRKRRNPCHGAAKELHKRVKSEQTLTGRGGSNRVCWLLWIPLLCTTEQYGVSPVGFPFVWVHMALPRMGEESVNPTKHPHPASQDKPRHTLSAPVQMQRRSLGSHAPAWKGRRHPASVPPTRAVQTAPKIKPHLKEMLDSLSPLTSPPSLRAAPETKALLMQALTYVRSSTALLPARMHICSHAVALARCPRARLDLMSGAAVPWQRL